MLRLSVLVVVVVSMLLSGPVQAAEPAEKANAAIKKALEYLKARQDKDGGWRLGDRDVPALTALALRCFVQSPEYDLKTDFVARGYGKLVSDQLENGGIYKDLLASYNTAIAISALAAAKDPAYKERIERAVNYLKSLQWVGTIRAEDGETQIEVNDPWFGGWGYGGRSRGRGRPDLSNAHLAMEALKDAGLKPDDPAFQNALKFVTRLQNNNETNDAAWAGTDGSFIYGPSDNGKGESFAGEYQGPDGRRRLRGYGSMTYAGLKSYIYAGLTREDPRVKAAWEWVRANWTLDEHPGLSANDPKMARAGIFYYYHTLARALNVYDEPVIVDLKGVRHDWRLELIEKLVSLQRDDGSWVGENRWMEENPVLVTAYAVLALQEALADLKEHPVGRND